MRNTLVRIALVVALVLVLICGLFVHSESRLDYIPIRFTMYKREKYDVFRRAAGKKFEAEWNEEHPDRQICVIYEPIGGNYPIKLSTEVVANTAQDIFIVPDYFKYASQGTLLDLTPHIEKNNDWDYLAEIYPSILESLKIDGHIYALPGNLNTDVLYYNRALFRKAGVPYPDETWDWDDMLAAAKQLTVRDEKGRPLQYGLVGKSGTVGWVDYIVQNGGRIWSEDGSKCVINSPEAAEAMRFVVDLSLKHHVTPTTMGELEFNVNEAFQTNRAAMLIGGRWLTAVFWELTDVDWSVAPLPISLQGLRRSPASFLVLGVYAKTHHPDIVYQFLKFFTQPEQNKFLVAVGDSIPLRWDEKYNVDFLNEPRSEPGANKAYLLAMQDAYTYLELAHPDVPDQELSTYMQRFMDLCYLGDMTPDEALMRVQERLQEKLEEYTAPPKTPPIWPYAVGFAALLTVGVPGGLWLRRVSKQREA